MLALSKRTIVVLGVGAVLLSVVLYVVYTIYLSPTGLKARENSALGLVDKGPAVRYIDLDGNDVTVTAFTSDALIVNVWASWSPFTAADHAILHELKSTFGDRITIRAVNRMESKETAQAYLDTIGKRDGIEYVLDTTDHLYFSQGGYAMPETFVFDKTGSIRFHKRGTLTFDETKAEIEAILR